MESDSRVFFDSTDIVELKPVDITMIQPQHFGNMYDTSVPLVESNVIKLEHYNSGIKDDIYSDESSVILDLSESYPVKREEHIFQPEEQYMTLPASSYMDSSSMDMDSSILYQSSYDPTLDPSSSSAKKRCRRMLWSEEEKKVLKETFTGVLEVNKLPSLTQCREIKEKNPCLHNRTPEQIKATLNNWLVKVRKSKSNGDV